MALGGANSADIKKKQKLDIVGNLINVALGIVATVWKNTMVTHYGTSFPSSLWTGKHVEMNASCRNMFRVVHWSAFFTLLCTVMELSMLVVLLVPKIRVLCVPCLVSCRCLDFIAWVCKLVLSVWGLIVVLFMVTQSECSTCHDLHLCAWWCYLGLFLMQLIFGCCQCRKHRSEYDAAIASLEKGDARYGSVAMPSTAVHSRSQGSQGHRSGGPQGSVGSGPVGFAIPTPAPVQPPSRTSPY